MTVETNIDTTVGTIQSEHLVREHEKMEQESKLFSSMGYPDPHASSFGTPDPMEQRPTSEVGFYQQELKVPTRAKSTDPTIDITKVPIEPKPMTEKERQQLGLQERKQKLQEDQAVAKEEE